jgi:hypothetical protein
MHLDFAMNAPRENKTARATSRRVPADAAITTVVPARSERSRVIDQLESIITQDIGGRGLAVDPKDNLVTRCRGNLARAARHLASEGAAAAIVTGFYVAGDSGPTIETDGPCGAIALAWLLAKLGYEVTLVTDPLGARPIDAAARTAELDRLGVAVEIFPFESADAGDFRRRSNFLPDSRESLAFVESFFRTGRGGSLTHLIAIERAGPSHMDPSHVAIDMSPATDEPVFELPVRLEHRENEVYNFRGQIITEHTAKTHLLFDFVRQNKLPIRTIGIGDGGNEIGMGSIPWEVIDANIPSGLGAMIACRSSTDWTIACGVSNWGAYALGAAVAWLRGRPELLAEWSDDRERAVLAALVDAGAVDGVTRRPTMSVDGLAIEQHLAIWTQIRDAARLQSEVVKS